MFGSCATNSVVIKQDTQVKYCQAAVTRTQVAVNYQWNVSSLSINMLADNQTTTLGRHNDQHISWVSVNISADARPICQSICWPTHLEAADWIFFDDSTRFTTLFRKRRQLRLSLVSNPYQWEFLKNCLCCFSGRIFVAACALLQQSAGPAAKYRFMAFLNCDQQIFEMFWDALNSQISLST